MKTSILLHLVFAFNLFVAFSCEKPEPPDEVHHLDAEAATYWAFDEYSTWVYRDSATGILDTVQVSGSVWGTYEYYSPSVPASSQAPPELYEKFDGVSFHPHSFWTGGDTLITHIYLPPMGTDKTLGEVLNVFEMYLDTSGVLGSANYLWVSDHQTVTVAGLEYTDVFQSHSGPFAEGGDSVELFSEYAPHVGLIRRRNVITGQTWELQKYMVFQDGEVYHN